MTGCSSCRASNPSELRFCTACGRELDQGLAQFLSKHGLRDHLGALQQHDLLSIQDVLALGDEDFRELTLPYGDLVRLKNAIQELRAGDRFTTTTPTEQAPSSSPPIQPTASSHPLSPQSRSNAGKLLAGVVLTIAAGEAAIFLFLPRADRHAEKSPQMSDPNLSPAEQAVREAESELALLRSRPASSGTHTACPKILSGALPPVCQKTPMVLRLGAAGQLRIVSLGAVLSHRRKAREILTADYTRTHSPIPRR
jgi:hypothetical protein